MLLTINIQVFSLYYDIVATFKVNREKGISTNSVSYLTFEYVGSRVLGCPQFFSFFVWILLTSVDFLKQRDKNVTNSTRHAVAVLPCEPVITLRTSCSRNKRPMNVIGTPYKRITNAVDVLETLTSRLYSCSPCKLHLFKNFLVRLWRFPKTVEWGHRNLYERIVNVTWVNLAKHRYIIVYTSALFSRTGVPKLVTSSSTGNEGS